MTDANTDLVTDTTADTNTVALVTAHTVNTTDGDPLTPDQRARAEALRIARSVLVKTGFLSANVPDDVEGIISIAEYILHGLPDEPSEQPDTDDILNGPPDERPERPDTGEEESSQHTRRRPWWVSWYTSPSNEFEYHGPWWITGSETGYNPDVIYCAAVMADTEQAAQEIIRHSFDDRTTPIRWRFTEDAEPGWEPFTDRFPRREWMRWPWPVGDQPDEL